MHVTGVHVINRAWRHGLSVCQSASLFGFPISIICQRRLLLLRVESLVRASFARCLSWQVPRLMTIYYQIEYQLRLG